MQIRNEPGAWVDAEFETLDLGDPRRDRRAKELLKRFAAQTSPSRSERELPDHGTATLS
ncbi:transposase DNA-binding-containing protein [Paraburkholderia sp. JHI2823]|uniref:IS4/Tn5 family transposase DNA-binding protein n=1 Tax=Paraburkholderia sp. JHI2823 TaxID=3112960 RepID=UPI003179704A